LILLEYKELKGLKLRELASALKLTVGVTKQLIYGFQQPSVEQAVEFERLTEGSVQAHDWKNHRQKVQAHTAKKAGS